MRILTILGTRPEAIKLAPVIHELSKPLYGLHSSVCATGQHREMLDQALALFAIQPDYRLEAMVANQTLAGLTARLFTAVDAVIQAAQPDWILVQGDTTTVFVSGMLAHYHKIRLGHVEAGLRTGDKFRPFPEEMNRRIVDLLADAYFAPTQRAQAHLLREGVPETAIYVTGNTVVDALQMIARQPFDWSQSALRVLPQAERIVLITLHRRENFGDTLRDICLALATLAAQNPEVLFVYPVHLNPNIHDPVHALLGGRDNIVLLPPLNYQAMIHLMQRATLVMTDSGGIQEEAPTFGVPVLVLRDVTERPEGIAAGVARLVGTQREAIVAAGSSLLHDEAAHAAMAAPTTPYGDGRAAQRIATVLAGGQPDAFVYPAVDR